MRMMEVNSRHSRGKVPGWRRTALACTALLACGVAAAQSEVQFLRSWQPADNRQVSDVSGMTYGADGGLLYIDRNRGALWRLAGETASATELSGS